MILIWFIFSSFLSNLQIVLVVDKLTAITTTHIGARSSEFTWVNRSSVVGVQIENPRFRVSIFNFKELYRQLLVYSWVVVVEILPLFCPMGNWPAFNGFNSNIRAICLQPIVSNRSETFGAFATIVFGWKANVHPCIRWEGNSARNTASNERSLGKKTNLVLLWCLMFVSLGL